MGFLKKFGLTVAKIIGVVSPFVPGLGGLFGASTAVVDRLHHIFKAVMDVESIVGVVADPNTKTGSLKLKAATPLVAQIIQSSELVAGKKIRDEKGFIAACTTITGGVADLLNSLGD